MPAFVMKAIKPKKLSVFKFTNKLRGAAFKRGNEMVKDFERTTKTWQGDKPKFGRLVSLKGGNLEITSGVIGGRGNGPDKWRWLDEGTSVRYWHPDKTFRPKTEVGNLDAGFGTAPKSAYVDTSWAADGIEARGWSEMVQDLHAPRWKKDVAQIMRDWNRNPH